ncbi:MAG: hypothetical protein SGJ05_06495, partial [bacterium]|nr:hypothetical protein [bacterium]
MKIVALHIITKSRIALAMLIALSCTIGAVDALAQLPVRAREVRLLSNNNTNYVSLQAPNGLASNWNLLAPLTVGVSNAIPITTVTGSNSQLSWIAPGANGTVLGIVAGAPSWTTFPGWNVLGNAGTNEATNFLGTTDAQDLLIRSNNQNRIRVNQEALSGVDVSRPVSVDGSYNVLGLSMNMTNGPSHNVATDGTRMLMNSLDFGSGGVAGAAQTGTLYGNWTRFWMQRGVGTTYNDLVGNYFHWQANNTAVIGTLTGYFSERRSGATNNTVGTLYQFRAELPGNGTVTNLYGFHMGTPLGTVTNIYGVNIENLPAGGAPAGKYAFRYNGSAGNVPFSVMASGQVGIGTLSPAATSLLEVTGTAGTANIRAGSLSGASLVSAYAPGVNDGLVTVDVNGDLLKRTFSSALDPTAWLLAGNAGATASSFIGPTTASVPLNFATANAVPGSMNFYLGTVAPANVRMSLSTGSGFLIGNATNSVNTSITGTLNSTGTTTLASANLSNVSLLSAVIPGTLTVNGTALTPNVTMTSFSRAAKAPP